MSNTETHKLFFFFLPCPATCEILVPWSGTRSRMRQQNCTVLTTGPPGTHKLFDLNFVLLTHLLKLLIWMVFMENVNIFLSLSSRQWGCHHASEAVINNESHHLKLSLSLHPGRLLQQLPSPSTPFYASSQAKKRQIEEISFFLIAKFSFATKRSTKDLNDLTVLKLRKDHLPIVWSKYSQCYQGQ